MERFIVPWLVTLLLFLSVACDLDSVLSEPAALLEGCMDDQPVSAGFMETWWVAQVAGAMAAIAGSPALAEAAAIDLRRLVEAL